MSSVIAALTLVFLRLKGGPALQLAHTPHLYSVDHSLS